MNSTVRIERTPQRQFQQFANNHFEPNDLVEIRAIASSGKTARLVERIFVSAKELSNSFDRLKALNTRGANIYFGVNPRDHRAGGKEAISVCRHVWADFDDVNVKDALNRIKLHLPPPSTIVFSGHGVHLYWRLSDAISVSHGADRDRFEATLQAMYRDVAADSIQDVSRLLRLPGFLNQKREPVACTLVSLSIDKSYSLDDFFRRWPTRAPAFHSNTLGSGTMDYSNRVRGLLRHLSANCEDRSRRDFGVICGLIRLGLSDGEIRALVQDHSKFATSGEKYFQTTLRNAHKFVHSRSSQ